jgi:hypothetical protein
MLGGMLFCTVVLKILVWMCPLSAWMAWHCGGVRVVASRVALVFAMVAVKCVWVVASVFGESIRVRSIGGVQIIGDQAWPLLAVH